MKLRVGQGYDVHRLVPGRKLVLGGEEIPFDRGLDGHSDADVLLHALGDALLGAASLGDLGVHFPPSDPEWKGVSSAAAARAGRRESRRRGFHVVNCDLTLLAEAPRLAPFRDRIRARVAARLGVEADAVGLKATTNEGLGAIGRGEGMAALRRRPDRGRGLIALERIVGFHPVREALRRNPAAVRRVLVEAGRRDQRRREIELLCVEHGVRVEELDEKTLRAFARGVTNGFAAEVDESAAAGPTGVHGDPNFILLVEDVQDPRNLGALLRVCEGAGVGRVLLREHGSSPLTETAVKASAGAAGWLEVEKIGSSAQALERLREEGYWIYGLAAGGDAPWEIDLTGKIAICVGGEQDGLRRLTRETCDRLIGLPMRGRIESLNLATAAAAVLYEAVRQRSRP